MTALQLAGGRALGPVIGRWRAPDVLARLLNSRVETIPPSAALHRDALRLAERIGQNKAYDAHYLALAAREDAPFWTADKRLANAAQTTGLMWVHWIGDWTPDSDA